MVPIHSHRKRDAARLISEHGHSLYGVSRVKTGADIVILSTGAAVHEALKAAEIVEASSSLTVGVVDLYRIKPLPITRLLDLLSGAGRVVTLEEHYLDGGIGSMIATVLMENSIHKPFLRLGMNNQFSYDYGSREYLLDLYDLSGQKAASSILSSLS